MADIPHADGPYSDNTTYGVKKATAIEALRRTLEIHDLGWISAVSECTLGMLCGWETCIIRVITNKKQRYKASVRFCSRDVIGPFPVSHADVLLHDYHADKQDSTAIWLIDEDGEITSSS